VRQLGIFLVPPPSFLDEMQVHLGFAPNVNLLVPICTPDGGKRHCVHCVCIQEHNAITIKLKVQHIQIKLTLNSNPDKKSGKVRKEERNEGVTKKTNELITFNRKKING